VLVGVHVLPLALVKISETASRCSFCR
jgi:hypothetical protein